MSTVLHPVAGTHAREVVWRLAPGMLSFLGDVGDAPGLEQWCLDGVIVALVAEPNALRIELGDGHTWRTWGAAIRTALASSLEQPDLWAPAHQSQDPDAVLTALAQDMCCGEVGEFVRSHGGDIAVVGVANNVVDVTLSGACEHCPALGFTLQARVERALREVYPALEKVQLVG